MQLPGGRRRPIQQSFRPEGLLVYGRLSDPILVKRAKDGDRQALAALCERHAPRVEKLSRHLLHDPEDAPTDLDHAPRGPEHVACGSEHAPHAPEKCRDPT